MKDIFLVYLVCSNGSLDGIRGVVESDIWIPIEFLK